MNNTRPQVSMTSLLPHTVSQPTKWRFLPKNLCQLVIDWTCVHLIMRWQKSPKFDFQSQFSISKISFIILIFVFIKIMRLGEQLIIKPFFGNFIFWISSFSEIGPYFCRLMIKWTQVQSQKLLAGSNSWAKISIWLAVLLFAQKMRSC